MQPQAASSIGRTAAGALKSKGIHEDTLKYKTYSKGEDALLFAKHIADLEHPSLHAEGYRPKPEVVELLNITEHTHKVQSAVDINQPLFQPSPAEVVFHSYEPFKNYEAALHLRNNDTVARRVTVECLDSTVFHVERIPAPGQAVGSKIAAGMEAVFKVSFLPESIESYEQQLVVVTEREKFIVPLLAIGASAALDLPDNISMPAVAVKKTAKQSLLISNVGRRTGSFQLATSSSCFAVTPSRACLAPGEALQLLLEFTPPAPGHHAGELEVVYEDSNRTTFTAISGQGLELDVGVSESQVVFLPTYMGKLSQRSLRVFNHSNTSISFSLRRQPSVEAELVATYSALAAVQNTAGAAALWGGSISGAWTPRAGNRVGTESRQRHRSAVAEVETEFDDDDAAVAHQQQSKPGSAGSDGCSEDQLLLEDAQLAAMRRAKRAKRDLVADKQLFGTPHFSVFPTDGTVHPGSEQEVIFQFAPDCARDFDALAWLELQGKGERLPVQLQGQGLGAHVLLTYDAVDIGEAFVNTEHQYQVELLNKGKVDAHWSLQPCHTSFGSKFTFSPTKGMLPPGAGQTVDIRLLSDCLGQFNETFQVQLKGSFKPVTLNIKGAVVGPQFALDVQSLDYSIASYAFRYTQEIMLANTGAIPLTYHWHMAEDSSLAAKDFTILPSKGTVLPYAKQKIVVEFQPMSVQRYNLNLVMDIPGVRDVAAKLPVVAECAVPIISLAAGGELLQYGHVFLRHPYSQQFTLVNESKLPAKFEILPQDQQSQSLGALIATPAAATVPAKGTFTVSVCLEAERLGRLQLPLYVRVAGSRNKPLQVIADAKAVGPSLEFALLPPSLQAATEVGSTEGSASTVCSSLLSDSSTPTIGTGPQAGTAASAVGGSDGSGEPATALNPSCEAASNNLSAEASATSHAASTVSTTGRARASSKMNATVAGQRQRNKSVAKPGPPPLQWASTAAMNFDKVQVLQQHMRELKLRNPTLVDADIKLFVEGVDSVFEVEPRETVVPAGGELSVVVRVLLDDNVTFREVLHVLVAEGADVNIPLEATGVGNTVVSGVFSRSELDFGAQFVGRSWQLEVEVANKGRKGATLTWTNSKLAELAKTFGKSAKGIGKKFDPAELPPEQQPVFSISPDKVLLAPKETSTFVVTGVSYKPGLVTEQLQCQYSVSGSTSSAGSKPRPVFDIAMLAEVAAPLLDLSKRAVEFVYTHVHGSNPQVLVQPVEIRNVSKLPLITTLKVTTPFSIDPAALSLQPQESAVLSVSFDPDFQHDLVSRTVKQHCLITYPDNPHKDNMELTGVVNFPNLSFGASAVDFGCVLMDSMRRVSLDVTNPGCVPVEYCWSWVAQDGPAGEASIASTLTAARSSTGKGPKPPANQLFDILPIHGVLQPGQKEQVEFSFYAYPGVKANAVAACTVADGPVYQFPVSGESNSIKYDVSPQFFDCGLQPYDRPTDRELAISNTGKVAFDFSIDLSRLSRPTIIEASPISGKIAAAEKVKIKLKVKPGVPARLMELLLVSIAHFEPVQVQVLVEGTYPTLALNLPRIKDQGFLTALEAAHSASDVGLTATVSSTLDPTLLADANSFKAVARQGQAVAVNSKGSKGPGSVAGQSIAGTAASAAGAAHGRPGSGAKSQISAVSGASTARSKASAATAAAVGAMMAKDKLSQLFAALPADKQLDSEAERLRLVQQLLSGSCPGSTAVSVEGSCASLKRSSNSINGSRKRGAGTSAELSVVPQQTATADTTVTRATRHTPVAPKLPQLVSGHYVLDFGSVIKGVNKSKKVKMTNMSSQLVQFVVDKQTLESFGFGMVPEAAVKLVGAPECQSTELTFTVMAAKSWVQPGPLELTLPLLIKGGPAVLLTLRAMLVVPNVVSNETSLDFGVVSSGHCKVYTVQLRNSRDVPAEWSIKKPAVDSPQLKDWSYFVAEPAEGVLEPGVTENVKITFTPAMGRESAYTLPLPIKVNYNPQPLELLCCGKGYTPRVEFSPRAIDCGAILPRFPGQLPAEATMQLTNLGDRPVEVVCLELDKQYMEDEEKLRSLDIYDEAGIALLRPLAPGERPWPELLGVPEQHTLAEAAAGQETAAVQQATPTQAGRPLSAGGPPANAVTDTPTHAAAGAAHGVASVASAAVVSDEGVGVGDLVLEDKQPQHPNMKTIVVLYGSPLAGTSAQAALVASRYGVPCVTLDELLQEAYSLIQADAAAAFTDAIPEDAEVQPANCCYDPRIREALDKFLEPGTCAALIAAELLKVQQVAGAAQNATTVRSSNALQSGQLTAGQLVSAAVKALKIAVDQPQYQQGFVLDQLHSKHLPHPAFAARCLLLAVGLESKALQQPEMLMEPPSHNSLSGSGTAAAGSKGKDKANAAVAPRPSSRPNSSGSGRGGALLDPPNAMFDFTKQDVWDGHEEVHVVELKLGKEEAAERYNAAVASAAAGLETSLLGEVAGANVEGEQQSAEVTAADSGFGVTVQSFKADFEAKWSAYEQESGTLLAVLGAESQSRHPVKRRVVNAGGSDQQLTADVVGLSFHLGVVSSVLPPVEADKMLLPPPYELRVVQQPPKRPKRLPIPSFKILTSPALPDAAVATSSLADGIAAVASEEPASTVNSLSRPVSSVSAAGKAAEPAATTDESKKSPRQKPTAAGKSAAARQPSAILPVVEEDEITKRGLTEMSRWVIPPHGSVKLIIQFASDTIGRFSEVLGFDVVCGERNQKVVLSGSCDYPRISTDARNLYYKTAKARPSTPQVKQQYIQPTGTFEFGPVLAGRDKSGYLEGAHPDHTAKFRITNNGLFDLHVDFWLKSEGPSADPAVTAAAFAAGEDKKKKDKAATTNKSIGKAGALASPPFCLHPSSMDLSVDDTEELTVFAFPASEGTFTDVVMCRLKDNPVPLEFPVSVIGAKPSVIVRLEDPPTAQPDTKAAGAQHRSSDAGTVKAAALAKAAAGAKALQKAELTVQFSRLLLGKSDCHSIRVSNTSVLPFKWHLSGAAHLPPEFKVYPAAGELAARSDVRVEVIFTAIKKQDLAEIITLEVLDMEEALGVSRAIPIAIKGEAHDIHVDIKFPQDNFAGVDFGPLRVVDDSAKQLVLKNTEKYEVKFDFAVRSEQVKRLVTIFPESGTVLPNKEVQITVHWNKDHSLRQEVSFTANTDIVLSLIDPSKDIREQQLPIKLSGHAQFSHYAVTPARGLHFGPHTYNSLSKHRCFEVVNLGVFPFKLRVFDMHAKQNAAAAAEKAAAEEAAAAKATKARASAGRRPTTPTPNIPAVPEAPPGALQLRQFTLDPAEAVVQPGCRQEVSVVFRAISNSSWSAVACLDISERDFADQPDGIPYELGGESCIPGIDTSNIAAIFEEHVVLSHLDPFKPINCSFGLRDKVFNFGTVLAQLPEACEPAGAEVGGTAAGKGDKKGVVAKPAALKAARASITGNSAPVAGPAAALAQFSTSLMDEPGAVKANLKFTNPIKVPCTVTFNIKPRGGNQPGTRFPIEVYPSSIVIPPHEYRHVALVFCPSAIQQYSATFEANVVGGAADPATAGFVCEVRGEGTLPSLSFQEPSAVDSAGRPWLKFGKLLAGKKSQMLLNVRNNGLLPAAARLEMEASPAYTLLEGTQVFEVESKKAATFTVAFHPPEVGIFSHELQLRVKQNPFEQYKVALTGECYQEDLLFAGLPGDSLNVLKLSDVFLVPVAVTPPTATRPASRLSQHDIALPHGSTVTATAAAVAAATAAQSAPAGSSSYTFSLVNESSNKHFRFKWPEHPQLTFSPSVGHIHAGHAKSITLTFAANAPVKLDGQEIKATISQITYKGEPIQWDDVLAASMVAAGVRASSATRASSGLPGAGPKPGAEPLVDLVAKTQRDLPLKVYATADTPRYECSAPSPAIVFRPTMMFQTRSFTFSLTNSALTALEYHWELLGTQGQGDSSGLYEITPQSGTIPGGAVQQFSLRFSPREVEDVTRRLVCHMPQLEQLASAGTAAATTLAGLKQLTRDITGKVLRPWCHFELPESDYMSSGRRNPELPGPSGVVEPLDPATKVLEFNSLGVRVRNTKQFFVLNSTSITYDFVWAPVLPPAVAALGGPAPASSFSCLTRTGTIAGGRRYEMVFNYTPTSDSLCESFWSFSIPSQGILVPFILVGNVAEPRVSLDRPAINFGQVQLGVRGKILFTLVNEEHLPFTFSLDKSTYDASEALLAASGGKPLLDIQPTTGTVAANSKVELCAVFAPQAELPINYNVVIHVRNKPTPVVLNVKGEGYALQPCLLLELPDDGSLEMSPAGINTLDFGQVVINDRVVKSLSLVNSGRVNYDFSWDLGSETSLSIKPQAGSVPRGERRAVEFTYAPTAPARLADYPISCQVTNGPKYRFVVKGSGYTPNLHFSFLSHDFGACHVWQQGMIPTVVVLKLQNKDTQAVSYDVLFDNSDNWQVQSSPCVLAPGQSQDIPISFKPTQPQTYDAAVPVRINGLYNINILLTGEGAPLHIELAKPEQLQRGVTFGAVPCGSSCSRSLSLVNRGKAAAFISFEPSADMMERLGVEVTPAGGLLLRPRETTELTMWYRPKQRMRPFKEPLRGLVAGVQHVLTTVAGACTGLSVLLASDSIPFGSVTLGSRTTKRLQLSNVGDLGCKFIWNTKPLGLNFSINPAEGFLAPGQDIKLEVSFHPTTVNSDMRVERLQCKLYTSSSTAADSGSRSTSPGPTGSAATDSGTRPGLSSDLLLTLTGACIESQAVGEPVVFRCNVRTSTSKTIQLRNTSSTNWQLRPVIQNDFWSGAEFLQVPAGGSADFSLMYKPLTMTSADGPPHEGSVFFPIPDGTGLLYKLHGQADQPTPEAVLELSLPAKTQHCQMLKVTNWLHKPQRFKVIKELLVGDASTRLEGATAIDVPALCDREYKLAVYSYTQGLTHARITFKNETTGEYTYYELKLSSSAPAPIGQLVLECPVRCATSTQISVANPMSTPVTMKHTVNSKQVSLYPDPPVLAANSATPIEVRYRPLLVGSSDAVLRLDSQELGCYEWKLKLKGVPTNPERSLAFSAPLGTRDTQVFRFTHWLPEKVEYKCSFRHSGKDSAIGGNVISSSGFDAPVVITAPPAGPNGVEVEAVVGFEPSAVGEAVRDVLLLSSAAAGAYEVPLVGQCVPPKPQGPVDVSKGSASIQFRNVFSVDAEFLYSIDNSAFSLAKASEKLPAKKPVSISVSYKPDATAKAAGGAGADRGASAGKEKPEVVTPAPLSRTGKLTVTCPKQTSTQWVFYLQA